jgi:tRNA-splicing ligase RtcB
MQLINGIPVFGEADPGALAQIQRCATVGPVVGAALMGDHHKGYSMPIGGVIAYDGAISPSGVGYDIGCGIKAVRTNITLEMLGPRFATGSLRANLNLIADEMARVLAFGVGRESGANVDHPLFDDPLWTERELAPLKHMAQQQLGTVGSGNHFVDLLIGSDGAVWVMAHFGSRGLGHKIASGYLNVAAGRAWGAKAPGENMDNPPALLYTNTDAGQSYEAAMILAGMYAYAGRDYVVQQVLELLGAQAQFVVHNHHNYAFRETHHGQELIVVRKGATPAFPGQYGAIGGSMGDISVIVRGTDTPMSAVALHSTVHGAGRVMSRTEAAGKQKWLPRQQNVDQFEARLAAGEFAHLTADELARRRSKAYKKYPERVTPGKVSPEMMREWLDREGVILRGGGLDESPHVYKRLPTVLESHGDTIEVVERLRPVVVVMAGADVFDPFKD